LQSNKLESMEKEIYWQAFSENDARFDGVFYTGVRTTGIFCRPSCTARLPKRRNVVFFDTYKQAEEGGFRACLRCKPTEERPADPQVDAVVKACGLLESEEQITLEDLSAEVGMSASHLQRVFKEIIGVSPKKYAEARRMEKFKTEIRKGHDVVTAMYDAGYGSSSRLYEKASENMGMTPAVYQKGGKGMEINYTIADSDIGRMLVARTPKGVCAITFGDDDAALVENLENEYPRASIVKDGKDLKDSVDAITQYLAGKDKRLDLPVDVQATAFQMQVWEALRKIPYGKTVSYTDVAEMLGDRKKVRAVASACAKNRVALVIPCHRVVGAGGALSGYRWGIERKKKLIEAEQVRGSKFDVQSS
jgi:AraC family transcriptional regulator, regulatory protein of adaptative response / methylated-DNA-[protein]-cysteine methyltransferase